MKDRYLEVTFRKGKPMAAYLYLPRAPGAKSARTEKMGGGLIVDFDERGVAIGVEILSPTQVSLQHLRSVLDRLGIILDDPNELSPILG